MKKLFMLSPEVAGEVGPTSEIANQEARLHGSKELPEVTKLEYVFSGWLGDELLQAWPCFIVTDKVATALGSSRLTGVRLEAVKITKSDIFEITQKDSALPSFRRLVPLGRVVISNDGKLESWDKQDCSLSVRGDLVVTGDFFDVVSSSSLLHCRIQPLME
jgi:hypothetical protein